LIEVKLVWLFKISGHSLQSFLLCLLSMLFISVTSRHILYSLCEAVCFFHFKEALDDHTH
jgi:hypothetical protein